MLASPLLLAAFLASPPHGHQSHAPAAPAHSAKAEAAHAAQAADVFAELIEGNKRFAAGRPKRPHQDKAWLKVQAKGQKPKAIIVGCADSRVPPEMLFDQGVGDLFVVRAAGCLADVYALGSIEYAVEHLGVSHLMVLGHEKCGAVKAALDSAKPAAQTDPHAHGEEGDPDEPGAASISALVAEIMPAVAEGTGRAGDPLSQSIVVNTRRSMERILERSPLLKHRVLVGTLKISCGVYSLETGAVRLTEKPTVSGGFVRVHGS